MEFYNTRSCIILNYITYILSFLAIMIKFISDKPRHTDLVCLYIIIHESPIATCFASPLPLRSVLNACHWSQLPLRSVLNACYWHAEPLRSALNEYPLVSAAASVRSKHMPPACRIIQRLRSFFCEKWLRDSYGQVF